MIYRKNQKNGDMLSALGFGCMRLPRNFDEVKQLVTYAIENGINYFDTAYIYVGNEILLGRALEGMRDKVKLATKMPPLAIKRSEDFERIFKTQLERLRTDHIDYYLIHMLSDTSRWERLISLGVLEWIAEKKRLGEIINIGFSFHGARNEFIKLVDAYDWEFCMIQYNYLDEYNQAGRSGLEYATAKGLPVMIMEPLRGGSLASKLPPDVLNVFHTADNKRSPAEWALRWVWNHPEVTLLLSGMNSMPVLEENLNTVSNALPKSLTNEELDILGRARDILNKSLKIPCTGCNYCMPCPAGVDIPTCFACFNNLAIGGFVSSMMTYLQTTSFQKIPSNASKCVKCGKCEQHCPQSIEIRKELMNVKKALEPFYFGPFSAFSRKVMRL